MGIILVLTVIFSELQEFCDLCFIGFTFLYFPILKSQTLWEKLVMKNQIKMFMFFVLSLNFKVSFKKSEIQAEINYKELQKTEK